MRSKDAAKEINLDLSGVKSLILKLPTRVTASTTTTRIGAT